MTGALQAWNAHGFKSAGVLFSIPASTNGGGNSGHASGVFGGGMLAWWCPSEVFVVCYGPRIPVSPDLMNPPVRAGMNKAGLTRAARHVFICLGPDCCSSAEGEALWDFVKKRIKETGIPAMRTKAQCFRICAGGPWIVVYPDGVWYGEVTPERFERILNEHLVAGQVIDEWVAAKNCFDGKGTINE